MFAPQLHAPELRVIAEAIRTLPDDIAGDPDNDSGDVVRARIARHFARSLGRYNVAFDVERFMRAVSTGVNTPTTRKESQS